VGEVMASLITGVRSPVDPTPFRQGRFDTSAASGTFVASYLG
jgi:hypothetical protein